jgi:hypothetical protein
MRFEAMSARARGYLLIAGARHLSTGLLCLLQPAIFGGPGFRWTRAVLAVPVWGSGFVAVGLVAVLSAFVGNRAAARVSLTLSAVSAVVWGVGFLIAALDSAHHGQTAGGLLGFVWCFAMAGKDLVVTGNPMRTPFEDLARAYAAESE